MDFQQRSLAERALTARAAAADDSTPPKQQWPSTAARIREARVAVGLTDTDVARHLNITISSYNKLERYNDEAFNCLSLKQLLALGKIVNVEPRVLLLGDEAMGITPTITFSDISVRLADRIAREGRTPDEFGDSIGWDITPVLKDSQELWRYDVEALYEISKALGADWVAALPSISDTTPESS